MIDDMAPIVNLFIICIRLLFIVGVFAPPVYAYNWCIYTNYAFTPFGLPWTPLKAHRGLFRIGHRLPGCVLGAF